MLNIERPTLHIGSLKILIDAGDGRNAQADGWISGERIVEGNVNPGDKDRPTKRAAEVVVPKRNAFRLPIGISSQRERSIC